jgi:hypothetical protein
LTPFQKQNFRNKPFVIFVTRIKKKKFRPVETSDELAKSKKWNFFRMLKSTFWIRNLFWIYILNSQFVASVANHRQGCQIFIGPRYQNRKNVPNEHKMYQMVIKCTKCP